MMLFLFGFSGLFLVQQTSALCEPNKDWPDAPCFDTIPVNRMQYKLAWEPYYDYKGADWMESQKAEMLEAIKEGTFHEWDHDFPNANVYSYYLSIGEVQNQYEYFFFEDEIPPDFSPLILIISIVGGITAIGVFVAWKIRK